MSAERDLNLVMRNLSVAVQGLQQAAHDAAVEIAEILQAYAKSHHVWRPVTGQTDMTTSAQIVEETEQHILIALSAETPWAAFLELARQGRFAWLWPAVEANRDLALEIFRRHLAGVQL